MKQVLQNLKTGETQLVEVPAPNVKTGHLLIRTKASLISLGTERMLIEFSKAGLIDKVRQQPDKVKQVIDKIKTDGLVPTLKTVRAKLDRPLPLGYCNAGEVIAVGDGVTGFNVGDRVVSNGPHAEIVSVPKNLCARIPDGISFEQASFTVLGSIALQGLRLAKPTLGESFVVTGLGLVGLLTVQLLRANGCRVLGIDLDSAKLEIARDFGIETVDLTNGGDPINAARIFTQGLGVDGVIITASTQSNEPILQAAKMCRKKGRIILVGVVGLELSRTVFYEKELEFRVSCSYGPGRYDDSYELKGQDYPLGYVRWTEQRNFEAVLDMIRQRKINVDKLISHHFEIDHAIDAYDTILKEKSVLGVVLTYKDKEDRRHINIRTIPLSETQESSPDKKDVVVGVIGAGNYTAQMLLPNLSKTSARLKCIASSGGVSSTHLGRKFRFEESTTDAAKLISDSEINAVIISTQHDTHASFVIQALKAGKYVFVEKPLAVSSQQLLDIESVIKSIETPFLMVGFNRRFAPQIQKMKKLLDSTHEPKSLIMTVNAGYIPEDHWVHDPERGGGRIIGEACHFIDLLRYLTGASISEIVAMKIGPEGGVPVKEDKITFSIKFKDGSFGTVHYLANGHKAYPKERLEVFCAGRILQLNNFRKLRGYGWPHFSKMNLWLQDKGHRACMEAFIKAVSENDPSPIPIDEILEVTRASFDIVKIAR